jgi:hypothetical protein
MRKINNISYFFRLLVSVELSVIMYVRVFIDPEEENARQSFEKSRNPLPSTLYHIPTEVSTRKHCKAYSISSLGTWTCQLDIQGRVPDSRLVADLSLSI